MKTVLVLAVKFPSTGAAAVRTLKFVKYLPAFGWRPMAVTPFSKTKGNEDDSLLKEISHETLIHRPDFFDYRVYSSKILTKPLRPIDKRIFIPDKYLTWNRAAVNYMARKIIPKEKIDLINTTVSPFSTVLLAQTLKRRFQIPIFIDFQDPFSFYRYVILDQKKNYRKKAHKIEKEVFKDVDHINNVTEIKKSFKREAL